MNDQQVEEPIPAIVSGGQTGADRAALDWAIENKVPHGGWCPAGRLSENGFIPVAYALKETASDSYSERTKLNVEESDGTLIVSPKEPRGGTLLTFRHAQKVGKPVLCITRQNERRGPPLIREFINENEIRVLNVAGPRASGAPEVAEMVTRLLDQAMGTCG